MCRELFVRIVEACGKNYRYFVQRRNAAGLLGFSSYQKISAAMRAIAYGVPADYTDEYLRTGQRNHDQKRVIVHQNIDPGFWGRHLERAFGVLQAQFVIV